MTNRPSTVTLTCSEAENYVINLFQGQQNKADIIPLKSIANFCVPNRPTPILVERRRFARLEIMKNHKNAYPNLH